MAAHNAKRIATGFSNHPNIVEFCRYFWSLVKPIFAQRDLRSRKVAFSCVLINVTDFIWYFIQFLASTELNPGIKRLSRDQGSGFVTILDQVSKFYGQNVRSVGKIYTSLWSSCITKQWKIRYVSRKCKIIFEYV